MFIKRGILGLVVACALSSFVHVSAQGIQTGTLTGTVQDQTALPLPGVAVTVGAPVLQGQRTTTTDANGSYNLPGLPPGVYTVAFELDGMETILHENVTVPLGGIATSDATLGLAKVAASVIVTAQRPGRLETTTGGANYTSQEIERVPVGRTPHRIAEFSPGLTDNTPNASQVTISGGLAYDNVFLVNGVDVNDNIFGTANNLFIEDAIAETQVLTSGISAEYGRFSGGVVNLVTRSGGNMFSGSARANLSNPSWSVETPFEQAANIERTSKLSKYFEGTLGGPIVRDRLWFFSAGRRERSNTQSALGQTAVPVAASVENDRYEIKLTGTPIANHTVSGDYLRNSTLQTGVATLGYTAAIDPKVLFDRETPNDLFVANYSGVVGSNAFVTAQYSGKSFGFRNEGGRSTAIEDSPFRTRGVLPGVTGGLHFNAPLLSVFDPQNRDNRQLAASVSTFLSIGGGSHDLKGGFEHFTSTLRGGGSQSATGYVFQTDYVTDANGRPALDASGNIIPRFVPGMSRIQSFTTTPGAELDIRTMSLYARDKWAFSRHLTFDLGVRYEQVRSEATGGVQGADTDTFVPRLGVSYDPTGDGKTTVQATYAHYAGKYSEVQFSRNTVVANPSVVVSQYTGPAGDGIEFAAGLDPANYGAVLGGTFPAANVFFDEGLSSPLSREFTVAAGREISRGYGKVTYMWRKASDFIEDFVDDPTAAGKVPVVVNGVNFGVFDRVEYRNADGIEREYQAVQFEGQYRFIERLTVNGHWTVQLRNHGNFEGEATGQPAAASEFGSYPEILVASRNFPSGRLNDFQRHKTRVWAVYNESLGRFGSIDLVPMWRYNSALTYSLAAVVPLSSVQLARNPGYARLPGGGAQTLYFDERGSEEFAGYGLMDFAASYQIPVWRSVRPWLKVEVFNVLNNQKLIAWNTTVAAAANSSLDEHGLATGYTAGNAFGTARSNADFPRPLPGVEGGRTFQVAFGLRF
jgi:hypothetical protein